MKKEKKSASSAPEWHAVEGGLVGDDAGIELIWTSSYLGWDSFDVYPALQTYAPHSIQFNKTP